MFTIMRSSTESIFITSIISLAISSQICTTASSLSHSPQQKESICTYEVTIGTTCTRGAETSNSVNLRFGDIKSNDILVHHLNSKHVRRVDPLEPQVLDDIPRKPFQACMVDQFQVKGHCVKSPICYLYLKLVGHDDWKPGFVQVRMLDEPHFSSEYFYFRRYLPRLVWYGSDVCDTKITHFGVKYTRKVFPKNPKKHVKP